MRWRRRRRCGPAARTRWHPGPPWAGRAATSSPTGRAVSSSPRSRAARPSSRSGCTPDPRRRIPSRRGRALVPAGRSRGQLPGFAGRPALEPIRVYAGLKSADSVTARARLVVREMDRTGAFERSVVTVVIPTGTGWVDSAVTNSLEYMYAGDTALVSMQYSYLPSWLSFATDRSRVIDA